MARTIPATMGGNGKPDREQRNQKCRYGAWKITYIGRKNTHYRGDDSYETDMARPFRISHRGGCDQDFDRSVSLRLLVQGQRTERLPYRQELDTRR